MLMVPRKCHLTLAPGLAGRVACSTGTSNRGRGTSVPIECFPQLWAHLSERQFEDRLLDPRTEAEVLDALLGREGAGGRDSRRRRSGIPQRLSVYGEAQFGGGSWHCTLRCLASQEQALWRDFATPSVTLGFIVAAIP